MKYRKKPVVIEAYQTDKELDIETLEGTMHASVGDYIITGVRGEKYPCKPDIFEQTYEPADASASTWHRCEDELPEIGQIVLVYDEWRRLSICQLDNSYRWLRQGGGWFNGPCACYWMPIEPPKEECNAD